MALAASLADAHILVIGVAPVSYTHLDVYKRQLGALADRLGNFSGLAHARAHTAFVIADRCV